MFRYVDGRPILSSPTMIVIGDLVAWARKGERYSGVVVSTSMEHQSVWRDGWRGVRLHLVVSVRGSELGVYADEVQVIDPSDWPLARAWCA